ncbi:MAG: glycosyltransferase family 2 protein [Flavobacteriales bacterium]|jgi:glycosyltransferase involved in cell wall biosynthesis|nr:glycosyltransferase family 2 protein [Flavobacteriales bacterium]
MKQGISILICTYNGEKKITQTIDHLLNLSIPDDANVELIVVDNGSTDGTYNLITQLSPKIEKLFLFHLIKEDKPGKHNAMIAGLKMAQYSYFLLCDDDNWLASDYLLIMLNLLKKHHNVGSIGGYGVLPNGVTIPSHLTQYQSIYAVGPQHHESGKIAEVRTTLWGAGCLYRKDLWNWLMLQNYDFFLSTFRGKKILAGEDTEYGLILRMFGFDCFYERELLFTHDIDPERLSENFISKSYEGYGRARLYTHAYLHCMKGNPHPQTGLRLPLWIDRYLHLRKALGELKKQFEKNQTLANALAVEAMQGELSELWKLKWNYNAVFDRINKLIALKPQFTAV